MDAQYHATSGIELDTAGAEELSELSSDTCHFLHLRGVGCLSKGNWIAVHIHTYSIVQYKSILKQGLDRR